MMADFVHEYMADDGAERLFVCGPEVEAGNPGSYSLPSAASFM